MCLAFVCDECGHSFSVPRCLTDEVRWLHSKGVGVRAARCLRFCEAGYIKVTADHIPFMELFGYEHVSPASLGITDANECYFVPKTAMPAEKEPQRWEEWVKEHE
jgi:hypothetical protein